jgi:hypothetical protein
VRDINHPGNRLIQVLLVGYSHPFSPPAISLAMSTTRHLPAPPTKRCLAILGPSHTEMARPQVVL